MNPNAFLSPLNLSKSSAANQSIVSTKSSALLTSMDRGVNAASQIAGMLMTGEGDDIQQELDYGDAEEQISSTSGMKDDLKVQSNIGDSSSISTTRSKRVRDNEELSEPELQMIVESVQLKVGDYVTNHMNGTPSGVLNRDTAPTFLDVMAVLRWLHRIVDRLCSRPKYTNVDSLVDNLRVELGKLMSHNSSAANGSPPDNNKWLASWMSHAVLIVNDKKVPISKATVQMVCSDPGRSTKLANAIINGATDVEILALIKELKKS